MECRDCHHVNSPGMKFCTACGASLPATCARCGAPNPPAARFCGHCGDKLAEHVASASKSPLAFTPASKAAIAAERRHVTVMFCDLVGSTGLSALLDPEDMRDLIAV